MIYAALILALWAAPPPDALARGERLYSEGRFAEAEAALREAVKEAARPARAHLLLGAALLQLGRRGEAADALEAAHRLDPRDGSAVKLLAGEWIAADEPGRAIPMLRKAAGRAPGDEEFVLLLIQALITRGDLGDMEEAGRTGEAALKRFPESPRLKVWKAFAQRDAGEIEKAAATLQEVFAAGTADAAAQLLLADLHRRSRRHSEAEAVYRELLGDPETAVEARIGLGQTLAAMNRESEAAELERAAAAFPGNVRVRLELSRVYARLGRMEEAAREAAEFRRLRPAR